MVGKQLKFMVPDGGRQPKKANNPQQLYAKMKRQVVKGTEANGVFFVLTQEKQITKKISHQRAVDELRRVTGARILNKQTKEGQMGEANGGQKQQEQNITKQRVVCAASLFDTACSHTVNSGLWDEQDLRGDWKINECGMSDAQMDEEEIVQDQLGVGNLMGRLGEEKHLQEMKVGGSTNFQQKILELHRTYYLDPELAFHAPARVEPARLVVKQACREKVEKGLVAPRRSRSQQAMEMLMEVGQQWEKYGWMKRSRSKHRVEFVFAEKKDGGRRPALDLRELNACLQTIPSDLPDIEYIFWRIGTDRVVGGLDVKSAFMQMPLEEGSQELVAFEIPGRGLWQSTRLVFGLNVSTQLWIQALQRVLDGLEGVEIFVDDVIIHANNETTYLERLEAVLRRLHHQNIVLNVKKM
jgi:hypothetical protein